MEPEPIETASIEKEKEKEKEREREWDLVYLRNIRNSLLAATDKYLLLDYPISPENLEIMKTYRQELRNIINISKEDILNGKKIEISPIPII